LHSKRKKMNWGVGQSPIKKYFIKIPPKEVNSNLMPQNSVNIIIRN